LAELVGTWRGLLGLLFEVSFAQLIRNPNVTTSISAEQPDSIFFNIPSIRKSQETDCIATNIRRNRFFVFASIILIDIERLLARDGLNISVESNLHSLAR
jgi:hypothetical protein